MKRLLLVTCFLFSFFASYSTGIDKFWVGGSGNWAESSHWSDHSGGSGGFAIPHIEDNVHFDSNSFFASGQEVIVSDSVFCKNLNWSESSYQPTFSSKGKKSVLSVYGSFMLPSQASINFTFEGILYLGADELEVIDLGGNRFEGKKIILDGPGKWSLKNDLNTNGFAALEIIRGTLITNNHNLCFGDFISSEHAKGSLDLGTSSIVVEHAWHVTQTGSFEVKSQRADIYFREIPVFNQFKTAKYLFRTVRSVSGNCTPSGSACSFFTITLSTRPETCSGSCDAFIKAVITGGTAPFIYSWFNGSGFSCNTDSCSNVCIGTGNYTVKITDANGKFCFCSIPMTSPSALVGFIASQNDPLCHNVCNGDASVGASGGIGAYTYSWVPPPGSGQSTNTISGLCPINYTCTITDGNGCSPPSASVVIAMGNPTQLNANGSSLNVSCFGACNGSAKVVPTGGTGAYTYSWNPVVSAAASINSLCPGNYTCTVTDANGCKSTYVAVITQPAASLAGIPTTTNNPLSCNGDCNATASVSVSGGTSPYTYSWNPGGGTTNNLSLLCAGTYVLTTKDANGCTITNSITITQPAAIAIPVTIVNLSCNSVCTGSITANPTGGTGAYTYSWSVPPGGATNTISSLCAGIYTITVTDSKGCVKSSTVNVLQPAPININLTPTNIFCFGSCSGQVSASVSGGTPGYTYTWAPVPPSGQGTTLIKNLCAGNWTLTTHDSKGCPQSQSVSISSPPKLIANASSTDQSCAGTCDGTISAFASGGVSPYTYSWNPGGTNSSYSGLCAGSYQVTVTDANGCTAMQTVVVKAPAPLLVNINSTPISCNGFCDGTAAASVSGGNAPYAYSWNPPAGQTTPNVSNLCAGTYTVSVQDASGCILAKSVTLSAPAILLPNATSAPAACSGACSGLVSAAPTGGTLAYTYSWSPGGQVTASVVNECVGTYTIHLTDAHGCKALQTVNVISPAAITPNITVQNITCTGACNGKATANPSGGTGAYTYSWSPGGQTTPAIAGLCTGNYTVTVSDANGCSGTQIVPIVQPSVLSAVISSTTSTCGNCQGSATVGVAGGTPGYTFSWNPAPGGGQGGPNPTGLCVGDYTVHITDANGCTTTAIAHILQTVFINITSSGTTLSCFGACDGNASANASGGVPPYTYSWHPTTPAQVTQNATNLCAGTYTVTANDSNGCFNSATVTFNNPAILKPVITKTNPTCNGLCNGSASVALSGGTGAYTYSWSPGGQTTNSIGGLCAGAYTLTVHDGKGCDSVITVIISQPPPILPNPTIIPPSTCTACDASITTSPSGGTAPYTYSWSNPPGGTTNSISLLCSGSYTVKVSDNSGCDTIAAIRVSSPSGPNAVLSFTPPSCNGGCNGTATATVSAGLPPYTYTWSPGNPAGQGTTTATGLCAGSYNFQVKDANGCIKIAPVVLTQPAALVQAAVVVNVSCGGASNGSITVSPSGGTGAYTYSWKAPPGGTTNSISGLSPGNYTLTVTDAKACTQATVYTITQPSTLTIAIATTNVTCHGQCNGTATANPAGGTSPYTYSWSSGQTANNITNLCAGNYTVVITDQNGCSSTQTCTITEPPLLTSSIVSTNVTCFGNCNGTAMVSGAGGTPPFTASWAPGGQTGNSLSGLCSGSYSSVITDSQGCTSVSNVTITQPTAILISFTTVNAGCSGTCNGSATSSVSGGTGAYTYSWNTGATTPAIFALCAGTYTLTVTDAVGCTGSQTVTIGQPAPLLSNVTGTNPTCTGSCNGSAMANPLGGTAPYTYSWSNGALTQTTNLLCAGSYTVNTTDSKGCTNPQTVLITDPALITSTNAVAPANCGVCNGTISLTPAGGTPAYTYSWTPAVTGQGTANASALCAGTYVVKVSDSKGCSSNLSIIVNNSGGPTGDTILTTEPTCQLSCNGSAFLKSVVGGTPAFTYAWYDSLNAPLGISTTISNLCAGGYILKITDASGCIFSSAIHLGSPAPFKPNAVITQSTCSGLCNGSLTLSPSGGTGSYTYSWSNGLPATSSQSNLCAGTYTVKITDANGCDSVFKFTFVPQTVLSGNLTGINPTCISACGGKATIAMSTGAAPYTYQWTDPLGQTSATASSLCSGTYTVKVTDANGCNINPSISLSPLPTISSAPSLVNPLCGFCNGSAAINASGGSAPYTYQWSSGATTATASNLCPGVYSVQVTDVNGCAGSFNVPISNSNGPTPSTLAITNATCFGTCNGSATATANGGTGPYTYSWTPGAQSTNSISSQCAGLYFVQVSDSKGCIRTDSVNILQSPSILPNSQVTSATCGVCNGTIALNPSGGTGPYSYGWSNALPPTANQNALCAATYTVTITDAASCSQIVLLPVNSSNGPVVSNSAYNPSCAMSCTGRDTIKAVGNGPFTYTWSPNVTGQGTAVGSSLCAGSYTVQVKDASGCINATNFTLSAAQPVAFSTPVITNPSCNGQCNGKITSVPSGGIAPYSFTWVPSPGTSTSSDTALCAGTYTVTVADSRGCTLSQVMQVTQPSALSFTDLVLNPHCDNAPTGGITLSPLGGTMPYTYSWTGPGGFNSTSMNISNTLAGVYTVTVTDGNSCKQILPITLTPTIVMESNAGPNLSFCTLGSLNLNGNASTNALTFSWYQMPGMVLVGSTATISLTPPAGTTTYELITGNTGCTDTSTVVVTSNPPPVVHAGTSQTILTNGSALIGGNPTSATGVSFHWSPSNGLNDSTNSNPVVDPITTTTYTVKVTDANGCSASDTVVITVIPQLSFPNGISPNGDGVNDLWVIDNILLFPNNVVEIYNRWGELLYQAKGYQNNWDGTYSGKPLPVGTYYYLIDLHDPLYKTKYSGPITILR